MACGFKPKLKGAVGRDMGAASYSEAPAGEVTGPSLLAALTPSVWPHFSLCPMPIPRKIDEKTGACRASLLSQRSTPGLGAPSQDPAPSTEHQRGCQVPELGGSSRGEEAEAQGGCILSLV